MQYYDINIGANKQQIVEAQGKFIYYLTGNAGGADTTIKVTFGLGGTSVLLKPGQSIRLPAAAKPIDTWRIENYANTATILGQVLVGDGDFKDTNTTGMVQVIDGGKSRTLGGGAFSANNSVPSVAGQYSRCQLWNPANSGVRLVVESISLVAANGTAAVAQLQFNQAQLANDQGAGMSKLGGGAAAKAHIGYDSNASLPSGGSLGQYQAQTSGFMIFVPKEPYIVPPGYGLVMWSLLQNMNYNTWWEWYEETNN